MFLLYVDFNHGLDANLFTEAKAKRLGEIALRPARVAFDHIEDRETYERALRMCANNGITELSNYVLYNSEDFGGKGKKYHADTPEDLYDRMRITLDLKDDINSKLPEEQHVSVFSFPMRYIPLSAHERGYVGSCWNAKFLRAVQCMLIPTQGKGVGSRSFFEADFGKNAQEFVKYLCMPDKLIAARGNFSEGGRGRQKESQEELATRRKHWENNQKKLAEWNKLFEKLGEEKESFIALISDNEYLPEKVLGISSDLQKCLYLHYLTTPRLIALLGMLAANSPTATLIKSYILNDFPLLYEDILTLVGESEAQQLYIFKNFVGFFGKTGVADLISKLANTNFSSDKLLQKWDTAAKKMGLTYVDFELIRIYRRFADMGVLNGTEEADVKKSILNMDMSCAASILQSKLTEFQAKVWDVLSEEKGKVLLQRATNTIMTNIQLKLAMFLEET